MDISGIHISFLECAFVAFNCPNEGISGAEPVSEEKNALFLGGNPLMHSL